MLEKATIARPYAKAAFAQAVEEGKLKEWSHMLQLLNLIVADDTMAFVLDNPKLDKKQQAQFIVDVAGDDFSKTGSNFVHVLVGAGRIKLITEIVAIFEKKRASVEGIENVTVTSAYQLDDEQVKLLSESLKKRISNKIKIMVKEDKTLIGGVVIGIDDAVIDISLKGRLKQLNNKFT